MPYVFTSIIAGISGLLGVIIGSWISFRIARLQLERQEKEFQRSRLLEIRKLYLVPLRETTSKWVTKLVQMIRRIENIGFDIQWDGRVRDSYKQTLESLERELKELKEELEIHRGQVTDRSVYEAIDKILSLEGAVNRKRLALMSPTIEWDDEETSIDHIPAILDKLKTDSIQLRDYLQEVNLRIEELLCGEGIG